MNKKLITIALSIVSLTLSAQIDYLGVTNNMVSGDFDNDGFNDDIAAFNTASAIPTLNLWTSEQGNIQQKEANCILPFDFLDAKSLNAKIVSGDFDNDGFIDDIAAIYEIAYNKTRVTVWTNNKNTFTPSEWWYGGDFDANQISKTVVSGDFDNDGFIDDIAAFYDYEQMRTKVFVWESNSKKFSWPETWWVGNDFNSTKIQGTIVSGDFDHDGYNDDIAALYNYDDNFCKAFVWSSSKNKFKWPYTWFAEDNFKTDNVVGNVVAGDFNQNGYQDNIAAFYKDDQNNSSVLVFEREKNKFGSPQIWWYGNNEALLANARLVSCDFNGNKTADQFSGLLIDNKTATLKTWTAENNQFVLPVKNWQEASLKSKTYTKANELTTNPKDFNIFPNPSNGNFYIDIPDTKDQKVSVIVYGMLGSKIYSKEVHSNQKLNININNIEKGTYIIKILGENTILKNTLIIE